MISLHKLPLKHSFLDDILTIFDYFLCQGFEHALTSVEKSLITLNHKMGQKLIVSLSIAKDRAKVVNFPDVYIWHNGRLYKKHYQNNSMIVFQNTLNHDDFIRYDLRYSLFS